MDAIRLSLLGPVRLEVEGRETAVDTRKATAVLAYVAMTRRPQARDVLVDLLWPDVPTERGRATLRRTLSALRTALGGKWVVADRTLVRLTPDGGSVDVWELRRLLSAVEEHTPEHRDGGCQRCLDLVEQAARLSSGPFMQGFSLRDSPAFESWMAEQSAAVERARVRALDTLIDLRAAAGDFEGATRAAEERLTLDPLSESTHRRLIELYAARADPAGAIRQYRECVAILERELGVGPLPETIAVYEAVLRGGEPPASAAPARPEHLPAEVPFVGRAQELARLRAAHSAARDRGRLTTIEGDAGIGKSRLAYELLVGARAQGAHVIAVECKEGEQDVGFGAITSALDACLEVVPRSRLEPHVLRAVAHLLPWLDEDADVSEDDPGAHLRLLEAIREIVVTALAGDPAGILFVDDAQWLDPASLDALSYLVRRAPATPVLVSVAWRSDEVLAGHPLLELARLADPRVSVPRLSDQEADVLVRTLVAPDGTADDGVVDQVRVVSEGLPLFVVEYAAAMRAGQLDGLPSSVRDLVHRQLARLPEAARQIVQAASVVGGDFDIDALSHVAGRSEVEAVDAVDHLVAQHVFVPASTGRPAFGFSHDQLRQLAYEEMGPARRQLLHRRWGDLLTQMHVKRERDAPAALVARHLELGGRTEQATRYHFLAGDEARRKLAHEEAVRHFEAAAALGSERTAEINEALGDVRRLQGMYDVALQHYEASAAATSDEDVLARLEHKLADVYARKGDWIVARAHLERACERSKDEPFRRSLVLADLGMVAQRLGDAAEATSLAERALEDAVASQDRFAQAQAHNVAGMVARSRGDLPGALEHLEHSLEHARVLHDPAPTIAALNNVALVHRARGDYGAALAATAEALSLSTKVGDRHREAALHNNMADLLHESGDRDRSLEHLRTASALFAEVGYGESGPLPEVWKLVSW